MRRIALPSQYGSGISQHLREDDSAWRTPKVSLGDFSPNAGAVVSAGGGAGLKATFTAGGNNELRLSTELDTNTVYDGSDLRMVLYWELSGAAPNPTEDVDWSTIFGFVLDDGTEDPDVKISGTLTDTILVDARTASRLYKDTLSDMTGLANAGLLNLILRRPAGDTYPGAVSVFAIGLEKVS